MDSRHPVQPPRFVNARSLFHLLASRQVGPATWIRNDRKFRHPEWRPDPPPIVARPFRDARADGDRPAIEAGHRLTGALLFALLVTKTSALSGDVVAKVADQGHDATTGSWMSFFWSAVFGGWLIALVAWLIQSGAEVIGQVALIWTLAFVVGLTGLDHCVSTTVEVLCSLLKGDIHFGHAMAWLAAVILGNVAGGVLITALLNYGQVRAGEN